MPKAALFCFSETRSFFYGATAVNLRSPCIGTVGATCLPCLVWCVVIDWGTGTPTKQTRVGAGMETLRVNNA